jgi:DNA processing protein
MGGGVDRVYPPEHVGLAQEIAKHGAVVSEFAPGKLPVPGNFPARNRIISGLSLGVLVIEGASQSGTKITASLAAQQGREVFAVPGPITSRQSQAPADLLKLGAKLVTDVSDILDELPDLNDSHSGRKKSVLEVNLDALTREERKVVELLSDGNLHIDEIVRRVEMKAPVVSATLTMLEIKGVVKQLGGMVYGRR